MNTYDYVINIFCRCRYWIYKYNDYATILIGVTIYSWRVKGIIIQVWIE